MAESKRLFSTEFSPRVKIQARIQLLESPCPLLLLLQLKVCPSVRDKICSYFQWEKQQEHEYREVFIHAWYHHRTCIIHTCISHTCIMPTCIMNMCILDTCIIDICILDKTMKLRWKRRLWSPLRGSHGLSARKARRTKSRGPKGHQLEVGAWRAPRLQV